MGRKKSTLFNVMNENEVVLLLAFIGGFVDSAGYLKLQGLFTSSITGNLVVATTSLYRPYGVICRSCVSIAFAAAAGLTATASLRMRIVEELSMKKVAVVVFAMEAIGILVAAFIGLIYDNDITYSDDLNSWQVILVGSVLGASMGIHNAAAKETIPNSPSTTVMTMTLVSVSTIGSNLFNYFLAKYAHIPLLPRNSKLSEDYLSQISDKYNDSLKKFIAATRPLILFLVGALVGAACMHEISFWSLLIPMGLVLLIVLDLVWAIVLEDRKAKKDSMKMYRQMNETAADKEDAEGKDQEAGDSCDGDDEEVELRQGDPATSIQETESVELNV